MDEDMYYNDEDICGACGSILCPYCGECAAFGCLCNSDYTEQEYSEE